jgi:hypothetical protein
VRDDVGEAPADHKRHQLIDLGDDPVLFGERWKRKGGNNRVRSSKSASLCRGPAAIVVMVVP